LILAAAEAEVVFSWLSRSGSGPRADRARRAAAAQEPRRGLPPRRNK
jgi:hypothetical protein